MLSWRKVWITKRPKRGKNSRPSPYCINWIDDDGVERRLCYPSMEVANTAKQLKEDELNPWSAQIRPRQWVETVADYAIYLADRSPAHRAKVARTLKRFADVVHPTLSSLITSSHCDKFMSARASSVPTPSNATRRTERQMLADFFAWMVRRKYRSDNPMGDIHGPPKPKRIKKQPSESEWVRMLEVIPEVDLYDRQGWHVLILLGILTGLRQSVLLHCYFGVEIGDTKTLRHLESVHRRDGGFCIIRVSETADGVGVIYSFSGKTLKEKVWGVPPIIDGRVARRISDLPDGSEGLFLWSRWQRKAWDRINEAAKTKVTFQSLRAASGTRAALARAERAAADQLDHGDPSVTREHYLDAEAVSRAVAVGQSFPQLPPLPAYEPPDAPRSTPGRRPNRT